jgi:tetratricopeptide (TPR) repeat protein
MLLYAASYDGQGAIAIQAARDYAKISRTATQYRALTLVRFGRFDEVLELSDPPTAESPRALWDFGRGYAHLRLGSIDSARAYLERIQPPAEGAAPRRMNSVTTIVSAILRAEILMTEKRVDDAVAVLEAAIEVEDDMPYAEPETLPFAARHWLGAILLEAKRPADAERVYREELGDHPRNGWSLFGLAQALEAQGRAAEAAEVNARFREAWARSDTWLRASRF